MCVNHLIHRDYTELGAEVAINIYDDRIETTSPGGIKESSDLERVDPSATVSYRRNPVIAEVFAQLKYMEKRGSGLRKIIEATSILPTYKEDRKPFFRSSRSFFFTTILNVNYGMDREGCPGEFCRFQKAGTGMPPGGRNYYLKNLPDKSRTYPENLPR